MYELRKQKLAKASGRDVAYMKSVNTRRLKNVILGLLAH